jgi:hypothetical protein
MKSQPWVIVVLLFSMTALAQPVFQSSAVKQSTSSASDAGILANGIYRNALFGFTYKVPYGWVDRTNDMRQDSAASSKSMALLSVFEHPPEATTDTLNSAVLIAAESVSSYPGLKNAAQYFGPLTEIATAKGLKVVNEPYEFPVDGKPIVRCDFSGEIHGVPAQQSTLVLLEKGHVISFTFIANDDDEMTERIEGLRFGKVRNPASK